MLPSNSLSPRPGEVGQGGLRPSTYDVKKQHPNHKIFFLFCLKKKKKIKKKLNTFSLKLNTSFWFHDLK